MLRVIHEMPAAYAVIRGSETFETIQGNVYFYEVYNGTILVGEIFGIPDEVEKESGGFLGFHIHEGGSCTGSPEEAFAFAGGHLNPEKEPHPKHQGDLPPLLSHRGIAWMEVYTGRFYPEDVIGKTIIIHDCPDDFRTQPSGGSGRKIACGEIEGWEKS